jgi:hypothetical protein
MNAERRSLVSTPPATARTTVVDIDVPGAQTAVAVRAVNLGGARDVGAADMINLEGVAETIESVGRTLGNAVQKAAPKKATVAFGIEVAVKGGKLVSLITEASGSATLNVTLEWGG